MYCISDKRGKTFQEVKTRKMSIEYKNKINKWCHIQCLEEPLDISRHVF